MTRPAREDGTALLAFFEAYFSNFIEGTEFAVDEALDMVFHGRIPAARPEDAHEVLGTFMRFLVSEVHPFSGGNGRVGRIMMNAELVAARETRIIIPTVYRNNYLMALRAMSQNALGGALLRALDFAQRYTAAIDFSQAETAGATLERTHAFADSNEAEAKGIHLTLPQHAMLHFGQN